jgi:hypothetical protein
MTEIAILTAVAPTKMPKYLWLKSQATSKQEESKPDPIYSVVRHCPHDL